MTAPGAPDAPASKPASSKRARILRRTMVGTLIAAGVAALLVLASRSESGVIVLVAGLALSGLACFEVQRMGNLRGARWGWVLGVCWLVVCALGYHTIAQANRLRDASGIIDRMAVHGYEPDLLIEIAIVALLAIIARAVAAGWGRRRSRIGSLALALWTVAVSLPFLWPQQLIATVGLDRSDLGPGAYALALLLAALLGWFAHLIWDGEHRRRLLFALWVAPLLVLPLPWLWHIWSGFGTSGLVAVIVLAKVGDIAGYYVGNAIGVRHPFPNISPGKTVAGCWGSFVVGTLAGGALVAGGLLPSGAWGLWGGLAAGAATNLGAQAGDLLESWIKRRAEVKDSGTWFGPSGGVLDLVDSLLLAVPVALVVWPRVLA